MSDWDAPPPDPIKPLQSPRSAQDRIADALERIAAALEAEQPNAKDSPWWRWSERGSETRGETS